VDTAVSLVSRLLHLAPVDEIVVERVKLDMQLMENTQITGKECRQGTLAGYMVKEYLLDKHNRTCVFSVYFGRVAVRASANFNITTDTDKDTVKGINHKYCSLTSRNNGYGYSLTQQRGAIPPTTYRLR